MARAARCGLVPAEIKQKMIAKRERWTAAATD
jgi:hypothetical protein